ncbi:MAG: phenylalanine--tRNA ligase subunit beta, partial [Candidatus Riflemargulisbacteria bacterium]
MLLPINWLKELIDINEDVNVIAEKLIEHSCEIDEIINQKKKFDHVIVGKITKIDKHPDADKLVVCQVTTGSKQYQIVTGATNVFEGAIIPVALDGADLPNGVQIKNSKLRGVDSNGMLCSETELGLSDEAKGIMILKDNPAIGTPIADYLQMNDQLLDVSITPNRGDLLSIKGLAREIAAIFKKNTNEIDITYSDKTKHDAPLKVINESSDLCARYMGVVIKGIKVAPSPEWMQKKLKQVNIKPISNIVDITNYVLYECGQPLHAFSYEKVKDSTIIVRRANNGETIKALNDQKVELTEKDLVITDKNGPVALAGIIGGVESAIHEDTTDIILESASFDPSNIRKSSFLKGIRTEASQRFEKGVDFQNVEFSFKRAIKLILEICGGHIASDICDVYEKEPQTVTLQLRPDRVNSLLGTEISKAEMINILTRLG